MTGRTFFPERVIDIPVEAWEGVAAEALINKLLRYLH
jgi:hypothetical protein